MQMCDECGCLLHANARPRPALPVFPQAAGFKVDCVMREEGKGPPDEIVITMR